MNFPSWPTRTNRSERGAVLPSPVVLLSILAVTLAAITFVATRGGEPAERDVSATKAAATPSEPASSESSKAPEEQVAREPEKPKKKPVKRSAHSVVVFNNTRITGLAGRVSEQVRAAGWNVAAADNWYGTVSATTVYYPKGQKAAAQLLALDLGVARIMPADTGSDMSSTNLTLILTGEL